MESCPHCGVALRSLNDAFCPECRCPLDEPPEQIEQIVTFQEHQRSQSRQKYLLLQVLGILSCISAVIILLRGGLYDGLGFLFFGLIALAEGLRRSTRNR